MELIFLLTSPSFSSYIFFRFSFQAYSCRSYYGINGPSSSTPCEPMPLPCHFAISLERWILFPNPGIWAWSHNLANAMRQKCQHVSLESRPQEALYISACPLKTHLPDKKEKKNQRKNPLIQKDTCTPKFRAALFTIAKTWKQPKCPSTDEWMKKMWYLCMMEYYSVIKKNEILPFAATWMDFMLNEISQRKILYITYMWNLKNTTSENSAKQTYRYREPVVNSGERVEEGQYRGQELTDTNHYV